MKSEFTVQRGWLITKILCTNNRDQEELGLKAEDYWLKGGLRLEYISAYKEASNIDYDDETVPYFGAVLIYNTIGDAYILKITYKDFISEILPLL